MCRRSTSGIKRTWGTGTNTLSVVALSQQTVDSSDGELKASLGASGLRLGVRGGLALARPKGARIREGGEGSKVSDVIEAYSECYECSHCV